MALVIVNPPRIYPRRRDYQTAKRVVDLILCLVALPVLIPVVLASIVAIYLDSGRPILFVQERIGRGGRRIQIYKFRTMRANHSDSYDRAFMKAYIRGGQDKSANGTFKPMADQEISPVGHFLRRTSLDELPQLINVLKGEMSIVGPRPNVPWEVAEYRPWHCERLEVLPGITGLAQVNGRSSISFDAIVRYDIRYIEQQGVALDLKIIWRTVRLVLLRQGAG
jgi:lipopolysaccharide/colanic/teichoic acid biosynthesis glycosyltransferase